MNSVFFVNSFDNIISKILKMFEIIRKVVKGRYGV